MNRLYLPALLTIACLGAVGLTFHGSPEDLLLTSEKAPAAGHEAAVALQFVGQLGGSAWAVDLDGTTAFVATGENLVVLDADDIEAANTLGIVLLNTDTPITQSQASAVVATGSHVYAAGDRDILVVSVADPSEPEVVASLPLSANDLAVAGASAYAVDDRGLRVIDIAEPTVPRIAANLPLIPTPRSIALSGGYAYVAAGTALHVVDVREPAVPRLERTIEAAADESVAGGRYLYTVANGSLRIMDIANPAEPRTVSDTALFDGGDRPMKSVDLALEGESLYVALTQADEAFAGDIYLVDVSDPATPRRLDKTTVLDGNVWDIVVTDGLVFAAAGWAGLRSIDFGAPAEPAHTVVRLSGLAQDVAVVDSHLYAVRTYGGLVSADVSDPSKPLQVGQYPLRPARTFGESFPTSIALAGSLALIVENDLGRVEIMSTVDPSEPQLVGTIDDLWPIGVAAQGDYAYITTNDGVQDSAVVVVDISQPSTPVELARMDVAPGASGIAVGYGYAYVVVGEGLQVLDVRSPASPLPAGFLDLPPHRDWSATGNVVLDGDFAYLVTMGENHPVEFPARLVAVDIRNPTAPVEVAHRDLGNTSSAYPVLPGLALSGSYVCAALQFDGLQIFDIVHPDQPRVVAYFIGQGYVRDVRGVAASDDFVFAAAASDGVLIFRLVPARSTKLLLPKLECGPD